MSDLPLLPVRVLHSEPALGKIRALAASPDGTGLWAGTDAGVILDLGLPDGRVLRRFHAHKGGVTCIGLDATRAATGGNDGLVRVWDRATLSGLLTLKAPGRSVYSVDIRRTEPDTVSVLTFGAGRAEWYLDGRPAREPWFLGEKAMADIRRGGWPISDGSRLVAVIDGAVHVGGVGSGDPHEVIPLPFAMDSVARVWRHGCFYIAGRLANRRCAVLALDWGTRTLRGPWVLPYAVACLDTARPGGPLYAGGKGRVFAIDVPTI